LRKFSAFMAADSVMYLVFFTYLYGIQIFKCYFFILYTVCVVFVIATRTAETQPKYNLFNSIQFK